MLPQNIIKRYYTTAKYMSTLTNIERIMLGIKFQVLDYRNDFNYSIFKAAIVNNRYQELENIVRIYGNAKS